MKIAFIFITMLISSISYAEMYSCLIDNSVFTDQGICNSNCDIECSELDERVENSGRCNTSDYDSFFLYKDNTYALTKGSVEFGTENHVKILDDKHNEIVTSILQSKGIGLAWLGATDKGKSTRYDYIDKSRFEWLDLAKLKYSNFDENEPDNRLDQSSIGVSPIYGEHWLAIDDNGLWSDIGYNSDGTPKTLHSVVMFFGSQDCVAGKKKKQESITSDLLCPDNSTDCMKCVKGYSASNDIMSIGQCSYDKYFTHTDKGVEINVSDKYLCTIDRKKCNQDNISNYYVNIEKDYELNIAHKSVDGLTFEKYNDDSGGIYIKNDGNGKIITDVKHFIVIITGGWWNTRHKVYTEDYKAKKIPPAPTKGEIDGNVKYTLVVKHLERHLLTPKTYYPWREYERLICDSSGKVISNPDDAGWNSRDCTEADLIDNFGKKYLDAILAKDQSVSCTKETEYNPLGGIFPTYPYYPSNSNIKSFRDLENLKCSEFYSYKYEPYSEGLFSAGAQYRFSPGHVDGKIPIILRVNYKLKKPDYKYSCPLDPNRPCIETANSTYSCSPYDCYDTSDDSIYIDNDTDTGDTDSNNDGEYDEAGNCLGEIVIFDGKDSRCRQVAVLNTGWAQCCDVLSIEQQREDTIERKYQMSSCIAEEKGLMANRHSGRCAKVGETYCSEYLGGTGTCIQEKDTYCCFEDDFQRAFTEAGKDLLGKDLGTPLFPDCKGFSVEELQKLGTMGIQYHPKMLEYAEQFGEEFTDEMMNSFEGSIDSTLPSIEDDILNQIEGM